MHILNTISAQCIVQSSWSPYVRHTAYTSHEKRASHADAVQDGNNTRTIEFFVRCCVKTLGYPGSF